MGWRFQTCLLSAAYSFGVLLTASDIEIPEAARPVIQSLLVALALLGVFVIGLVFEIIGSVFTVLYEANVFRKRLVISQWFAKFVEAELPDYAQDYRLFLELGDTWAQFKEYVEGEELDLAPSSPPA